MELPCHLNLPIALQELRPATQPATGSCRLQSRHGLFPDEVACKLG